MPDIGGADQVAQVEDFFVEGIEGLRKSLGVDKITLVGHSLGAYNAVCYAEQYPSHVERLVLAGKFRHGRCYCQQQQWLCSLTLHAQEWVRLGDRMHALIVGR